MRHFLSTLDWSREEQQALLDDARRLRESPIQKDLEGRSIALLFFNPSLRTRTSFELGAHQLGGKAIVLEPGKGAWPIAFDEGAIMDGDEEEHVAEAARVLSQYVDLIAVRAFPKFLDWQEDRQDRVIESFAKYATVPVINMETITHPCQELAHLMALQDRMTANGGSPAEVTDGKTYLLTWTYHPRPLNTAVANSALVAAARFGFNVRMLAPTPEYALDPRYMDKARELTAANGRTFEFVHDVEQAYRGADVVYAKSWGAIPYFGNWEAEKPIRDAHKHFIVDTEKMALTNAGAPFSHCLPARRNVKVTDAVIDSPASMVIEEAANRLHVQKALMAKLIRDL